MLWVLPLLVAVALSLPPLLSPVNRRASLLISRVALSVFGFYVANQSPRRTKQLSTMRAAHVGGTHRVYAARTLLYASVAGVVGSILGVYVAAVVVFVLRLSADAMLAVLPASLAFLANLARIPTLDAAQLFGLFLVSSATVGTASALGVHWARWRYLSTKSRARATDIEATLPRTVAFVYALSRSGMPFPTVLRTLTRNRGVYGEAAREVGVAVRDMEAFGTDVLTALQRMASRTPSEGLEEFGENLASVLGSGRNLSEFLHEQYERYQEEAEAQQKQYLDLLSTFAEIYVTVLVAGPLFFITVLVVIGLVLSDTLALIRFVGYVGIPLASAGFIVYIDSMTQSLRTVGETPDADDQLRDRDTDAAGRSVGAAASDGGRIAESAEWQRNRERIAAYDRFAPVRGWIHHPLDTLLSKPRATLAVTVPVGLVWAIVRATPLPAPSNLVERAASASSSALNGPFVRTIDGPLIEFTLLVLAAYAVVHEIQKRRTRAIEDAIPDFLDRLASVNEAGLTVTESIARVRGSELGRLGPEVERVWRDIEWGADARTALLRMEARTGSVAVSQAVTLITNAMKASGDISPVLRIAADESQETHRLRRERRQEMLTYLMVIYISFLVFLGIISALSVAFIPAVNAAGGAISGGGGGSAAGVGAGVPTSTFSGIGDVDTEAYSILFFHIAAIQGICSGFIAGQLGEGDLQDGVKHATILLTLAYAVALVLF